MRYEQGEGDGVGVVGRSGDNTRICQNRGDQPRKPRPLNPRSDIHLTSTAAKNRLPHRFPNVTAPGRLSVPLTPTNTGRERRRTDEPVEWQRPPWNGTLNTRHREDLPAVRDGPAISQRH